MILLNDIVHVFVGPDRNRFPNLRRLLFDGANFLQLLPFRVLWPGLAISLTVLNVNYVRGRHPLCARFTFHQTVNGLAMIAQTGARKLGPALCCKFIFAS
ncbi:hypothetical protein FHW03_004338 [Ochrobactrum sp. RH2CCR150]|nr:hypothetical protein [Ochrobactrum sp. RH2CCR150]